MCGDKENICTLPNMGILESAKVSDSREFRLKEEKGIRLVIPFASPFLSSYRNPYHSVIQLGLLICNSLFFSFPIFSSFFSIPTKEFVCEHRLIIWLSATESSPQNNSLTREASKHPRKFLSILPSHSFFSKIKNVCNHFEINRVCNAASILVLNHRHFLSFRLGMSEIPENLWNSLSLCRFTKFNENNSIFSCRCLSAGISLHWIFLQFFSSHFSFSFSTVHWHSMSIDCCRLRCSPSDNW